MLRTRSTIGAWVLCLALSACGDGESAPCRSLDETACAAASHCRWMTAACPDEPISAACLDVDAVPTPPPCAPQPCRTYLNEADCEAQQACNWWPETCGTKTYTDRCRNVGHGAPNGC
jgi:hypothetical protein